MVNNSLYIPYKLNFNTIAARITLPPKGDSTCAFNNQLFKKIIGVFTQNAKKVPINIINCVKKLKFVLYKTLYPVVPTIPQINKIASNKNNDPANV